MTDTPTGPVASDPGRPERERLEALYRLDVRSGAPARAIDDLVGVAVDGLGADVACLTIVDDDRSWVLASSPPEVGVEGGTDGPHDRFLADAVVRGDDDLVVVERGDVSDPSPWDDHPAFGKLGAPVTMAARAIRGPGGQVLGALEVAWVGAVEVEGDRRRTLARVATLAGRLLDLHAEANEYARFIELSPDPIAILDLDGVIDQANPAFLRMLGPGGSEDVVGRGFLELVARTDRARVTAELARVLFMQRRTGRVKLRLAAPDGRLIPCEVSAGHLRGVRRHLQLVVHDLSERLRVEDRHSQLSEQLARAQRLDAVGQVAGGLAHDLNNLLVVMLSNLSLAQESLRTAQTSSPGDDIDAVAEDLVELGLAIDRATGLTSQLLQFARQEEGVEDHADVIEVIDAVVALVNRSLGEGITLRSIRPDVLPTIVADPVQLERVLVNLVMNARDALEGNGTIEIHVSPVGAGEGIGTASRRQELCIRVSDDGFGMDEATRVRAFEPLFTTKAGVGGSGLGLATVLAFVEQVDGSVTLESAVGSGTVVSLFLPIADAEVALPPVGVDVPVAGARVVVVDSGERTRRVIHAMLTGAGYRVTTVPTGESALDLLADEGADVLITELALAGMPGTRLIAAVSRDHPEVKTIAVASVDQPDTLEGTPVLVKPFSHTRLLRIVEEVVKGA